MQKIVPFLWFDGKAEEAMNFYTCVFKNSKKGEVSRYGEAGPGPKGSAMSVSFQLEGLDFNALNAGPAFSFTPAISFFVCCENEHEIKGLWAKLSDGGTILMPLDKYPFSEKFGWLNDQFGVSWQLILGHDSPKITPFLMFVGDQHGKAEEAVNHYTSTFKNSSIIKMERYGASEKGHNGTLKHGSFTLQGQKFMVMDSNFEHGFNFTPAISFFVSCETQKEVDGLCEKLAKDGDINAMQCGWLQDKFGVSWQIIPTLLGELLGDEDPVKAERVMNAMMQMKKIDINGLWKAYDQK
jgi:predicted 3-demethylubiquinone-9 3-methyltransferase (glyoxalase superfamily)